MPPKGLFITNLDDTVSRPALQPRLFSRRGEGVSGRLEGRRDFLQGSRSIQLDGIGVDWAAISRGTASPFGQGSANRPLADDARSGPAVIDCPAGGAATSQFGSVLIRLSGPRAFTEFNSVVGEDGAFASMDKRDRLVVLRQGGIERDLGLGIATLSIEDGVDGFDADFDRAIKVHQLLGRV